MTFEEASLSMRLEEITVELSDIPLQAAKLIIPDLTAASHQLRNPAILSLILDWKYCTFPLSMFDRATQM